MLGALFIVMFSGFLFAIDLLMMSGFSLSIRSLISGWMLLVRHFACRFGFASKYKDTSQISA
jgi:hypothetical protein